MAEHVNKVEYVGHYGGDETHALSAWTSTKRELTEERRKRMGKLLTQLAQDEHHSPFEKSFLHFIVTCETASHIHLLKHRIAVPINGESARYKEHTDDKFYLPVDWDEEDSKDLARVTEASFAAYHAKIKSLEEKGYTRKRAKESARFFLPYASQVTLDVGFNFRSFMHFTGLRAKLDAQLEIHSIANSMIEIVRGTGDFPLSLEAFGY